MKVSELIEELKKFDPKLEVHFKPTTYDFSVKIRDVKLNNDDHVILEGSHMDDIFEANSHIRNF